MRSTAPPRMNGSSRYVDYQSVARRYHEGRSLPGAVLARWGAAVRPHLPQREDRPIRVADVGAGTGIFALAWPQWTASTVVAIEPSDSMIAEGGPAVPYVRGVAENLPLAGGSIDVAWVSTALHHFADAPRSVAELARVLRGDGRVLVRAFLPDRAEMAWLAVFPGRSKALTRCLRVDDLSELFGTHGFRVSHVEEVLERTVSFSESADWVERMRHADSMLTALTDEEVAEGIEALRSRPSELGRVEVSLVVFERRRA